MITTRLIPFTLAQAICAEGVPTIRIGYLAAQAGLMKVGVAEGQPHFEWDEAALNRRGVKFLETMLHSLRAARKEQN